MQTYINEADGDSEPLRTVRPNVRKVFVKNSLIISMVITLIIAFLIFLDYEVGLETFLIVFEVLDINIARFALYSIVGLLFASILIVLGNYLSVRNVKYMIYKNRIVAHHTNAWIFIMKKEISFQNVIRVSYTKDSVFNKILNYGDILIEFSGLELPSIRLECIDDVENHAEFMQRTLVEYLALRQMQFTENHRVADILKGF